MAVKTKAQIQAEINTLLADNTTGDISASDLRTILTDINDSFQGQEYKIYSFSISGGITVAPTVGVYQNTLSGDPAWTRVSIGKYRGTLADEFVYPNVSLDVYDLGVKGIPIMSDTEILGYAFLYYESSNDDYVTLDVVDDTFTRVDLGTLIGIDGSLFFSFKVYL